MLILNEFKNNTTFYTHLLENINFINYMLYGKLIECILSLLSGWIMVADNQEKDDEWHNVHPLNI